MNSMPVRNTERMMFSSIHNVEMPFKMPYLLLMFISSPQLPESQTIATCSLPESQKLCLEITVFARLIAECLEIKIVSAVNQICRFASTMKKKFTRKLTVACHRHPTEKNNERQMKKTLEEILSTLKSVPVVRYKVAQYSFQHLDFYGSL